MQLIDTDCLLDMERHFPNYQDVVRRAGDAGVTGLVMAGVTRNGWWRMLELSSRHAGLFSAPCLHPMYLDG